MPAKDDLYPQWQGCRIDAILLSGEGKLEPLDSCRYSRIRWTTVQEVLAEHLARAQKV